jgi:hypothetical protein
VNQSFVEVIWNVDIGLCSEQQEVVGSKNDSTEYVESIAEAQGSGSSYV